MASKTMEKIRAELLSSPIAGCVQPIEPYHDRCVRTLAKWSALDRINAVRLVCEPDIDFDPSDYDCYEPDEDIEAFGSIGQYRTDWEDMDEWHTFEPDDWKNGDSCWGHEGYEDVLDWKENPYILDIMAETIDQFKAAWKAYVAEQRDKRAGLCPVCHGTGRLATA